MTFSVLVADSDLTLLNNLHKYFLSQEYRFISAIDEEQMWYEFNRQHIDVVILNIKPLSMGNIHLVRDLRGCSSVGIIQISAYDDIIDKIIGLEVGADDYIISPYEIRELVARIRNLIWRISLVRKAEKAVVQQFTQKDNLLTFDEYELDLNSRKLLQGNRLIRLTKSEFELLVVFALHPQQVLSRERLMQQTSHRNQDVNDRTIDVIVRRLRNKMTNDLFVTVHGEGYLFAASLMD